MGTGEVIAGRYRLLERVGSGSMGAVWRAEDTELDRVVALKRAHLATTTEDSERVRREARAAAGVHHPGVVTLFDVVGAGAGRWLVMEYVPAQSLAEILAERGPLAPAEVARIGAELAAALAAVHAAGIVHRDIKPGNVLVAESGAIKLTDFGIARGTWNEATLTGSAMVIGTPAYLAPEVARGAAPTASSDVFGLGATLYAAVEGAVPYGAGENPLAMLRRAAAGEVMPMRAAGRLAPVLAALLAADPGARPSAADAQAMLARVGDDATAPTAVLTAAPPARGGRTRRVVVVGAVLALASAGGLAVVATAGSDSPSLTPASAGSVSLLGDRRGADPCVLLDLAALGRVGRAEAVPGTGEFASCAARVTLGSGARIDVDIRLQERDGSIPGPRAVTVHQFAVDRPDPAQGACSRTVLLPAAEAVAVRAVLALGEADPCRAADSVVQTATGVLALGPLPRRGGAAATDSLARARACELLPAASLGRVKALGGADPQTGFADWSCTWTSASSAAELRFARDATETGPHRTLSGHPAYDRPGAGTCLVRVVNLAGPAGTSEFADVVLRGPGAASTLCVDARVLAAEVAERLPTTKKAAAKPGKGSKDAATGKGSTPAGRAASAAESAAARAARCAQLAYTDPVKAAECGSGGGN